MTLPWIKTINIKKEYVYKKNQICIQNQNRIISSSFKITLILLFSMPFLWFLFLPRQAFDHDYECLLWAPFVSLTAAYAWDLLLLNNKSIFIKFSVIILFVFIFIESGVGFQRYYNIKYDYSFYYKIKNTLQKNDIIFITNMSKSTTAFLTDSFVVKVKDSQALLNFLSKNKLDWSNRLLVLGSYGKDEAKRSNKQTLLSFLKNKLKRFYTPLKWEVRKPELLEWAQRHFPCQTFPGGSVLCDITPVKEKLRDSKQIIFKNSNRKN